MRYFIRFLITAVLLSLYTFCSADEVRLKYVNIPASELLTKIREKAHIPISFDYGALSNFKISIDTTFSDGLSAIKYVVRDLPFSVLAIKGVVVISPKQVTSQKPAESTNKPVQTISGTIFDAESGEALPYANVVCEKKIFPSDANGLFRITVRESCPLNLSVHYLGYTILDTTLRSGTDHKIALKAIHMELKEILVEGTAINNAMQTGENSGLLRINHLIAQYLPGNGDNSVFNLMRMMPGVRAGGEPSELTVWDSKPGESAVMMDGYRLFSMNGYNEQISSINPFIVKEVRVLKGGYGPAFGNQTGAMADIIGVDGSREKPALKLNVNNLTANLFASMPIGKKAALSAAYRQTYYGLYDVSRLNPFGTKKSNDSLKVTPDYKFRDANIKLSGNSSKNDKYYISLYGASDDFDYSLSGQDLTMDAFEKNTQFAAGGGYNRVWKGGATTGLTIHYSLLDNKSDKVVRAKNENYSMINETNLVEESGFELRHSCSLSDLDNLEIGLGLDRYRDQFNEIGEIESKANIYMNNRLSINKFLMDQGVRADYYSGRLYLQPRLSVKYSITENFTASVSWGIYNQFLGKVPVIYEKVSPSLIWRVLGSSEFPVMGSTLSILNLTYSNLHWLFSLEGYNKNTWGLTRIYSSGNRNTIVNGKSLITGADLFIKWESRGSQIFGSFSYAKSRESYLMDTRRISSYTPVELKTGALWNLSPLFLSAEYVYAQGYSNFKDKKYNRLDVAATYTFKIKGEYCRTGISILNLLNSSNVKTLEVLPLSRRGNQTTLLNLSAESIPFTPTMFFQISL